MRVSKGKVVDGRIVVEGEPLKEGAIVTVLCADESSFELDESDETALLAAIAEADRGENIGADEFLSELRKRR